MSYARRLLVSALLLAALTGGCRSKDEGAVTGTATPGQSAAAEQSVGEAGRAYLQFEERLAQAKSLDDIKPLLASEKRQAIEQMGAQAEVLLPALKAAQEKDVVVKGEDIQGTVATVSLEAGPSRATGTATMLREDGAWKLLEEEWEVTESSSGASETPEE